MKNLTTGKPLKQILVFAVPLFIGQLFQLFYSLVDTRIVGETLGDVFGGGRRDYDAERYADRTVKRFYERFGDHSRFLLRGGR